VLIIPTPSIRFNRNSPLVAHPGFFFFLPRVRCRVERPLFPSFFSLTDGTLPPSGSFPSTIRHRGFLFRWRSGFSGLPPFRSKADFLVQIRWNPFLSPDSPLFQPSHSLPPLFLGAKLVRDPPRWLSFLLESGPRDRIFR